MKHRKPEKILTICGIVLFVIGSGLVFLFGTIITNTDFETFLNQSMQQNPAQDIPEQQFQTFFEQAQSINYGMHTGLMLLVAAVGVIALLRRTGDIMSGIFLLAGTGLTVLIFWWLIVPFLPALLYFIAGLMFLLRKPKTA
ncbi:DUF4064 domain-containing protein [Salibacterium qingdaonense]|uniref:DUF4064 domain-containing protein n=1 Tax=Salibacterium qingdaonense TaxID=266892 RepID=A0A1I4KI56_9BACI|nr:DUF4064 domain-containing protein [Salibacterium qingdaonense]SFL78283.1 Protein of unknown function [Salibacterium qingdaonense]